MERNGACVKMTPCAVPTYDANPYLLNTSLFKTAFFFQFLISPFSVLPSHMYWKLGLDLVSAAKGGCIFCVLLVSQQDACQALHASGHFCIILCLGVVPAVSNLKKGERSLKSVSALCILLLPGFFFLNFSFCIRYVIAWQFCWCDIRRRRRRRRSYFAQCLQTASNRQVGPDSVMYCNLQCVHVCTMMQVFDKYMTFQYTVYTEKSVCYIGKIYTIAFFLCFSCHPLFSLWLEKERKKKR